METSERTSVVSLEALNQRFEKAVQRATKISPPNDVRLEMYGLYKQATVGDCSSNEPSRFRVIDHAKWEAWKKLNGMTESTAKDAYTELVKQFDPQAREEKLEEKELEKPSLKILVQDDDPSADKLNVLVQQEDETVAKIEVDKTEGEKEIELETSSSGRVKAARLESDTTSLDDDKASESGLSIRRKRGRLIPSSDSPVPTWAVFLLGVLFLCFLDDNVTVGNMIINGLGVGLLTATLISLQMRS